MYEPFNQLGPPVILSSSGVFAEKTIKGTIGTVKLALIN